MIRIWSGSRRSCLPGVALLVCGLAMGRSTAAMPPGRAWAPIDTLKLTHAYVTPSRFEPLRNGRIELIAEGYYGTPARRQYGFEWADSSWRVRWSQDVEAYVAWPAITWPDRQMVVWKTTTPIDSAYHYLSHLIVQDVIGDSLTPPDTVVRRIDAASLGYSGAAWGSRRWVAMRDANGQPGETLRLFRSDAPGQWTQMRTTELTGAHGLQIAPLDSNRVMVLTDENDYGVRAGLLADTAWSVAAGRLADYASGGLWLHSVAPGEFMFAAALAPADPTLLDDLIVTRVCRGGTWEEPETLTVEHPGTIQHLFYGPSPSAEVSEHPALVWYGYQTQVDVASYVWVAFPTDSGFAPGERLEGSWQGHSARCVQDENGDVWVAWWRDWDGMYWTHSYCTATPGAPEVGEQAGRPLLRWNLSTPAPRTWWAVLRSSDGGPAEVVGRVRAGPGTSMAWADSSAPAGAALRYAVRRECRDVRYRVTSTEAQWRPRGPTIGLAIRSENPAGSAVRLELSGVGAGACEVVLFDLQGRQVRRHRVLANGSGVDEFELPLDAGLHPGLYFARAMGLDGRSSPAVRVVVVR